MFAAAALLACAALNWLAPRPPARPASLAVAEDGAVQVAALYSLGMRRLAADAELVRLLVYYGTPEGDDDGHGHAWGEGNYGGGHYPELAARARRIVELDPGFSYAAQYASGALAFNLGRPQEALDLLARAIELDPGNVTLRSYAAAIGVSRTGKKADLVRSLELLEPALADPECPTMIKSMAAFMHRRLGHRARAVALYRDIAASSRDWGYRTSAERALAELGER